MSTIPASIIIPCSRPQRLPALLSALARQTIGTPAMEVLVVTPVAPPQFKAPSGLVVRWVETQQLHPPGHMRNLGTAQARGTSLFFIDDDCIPPPTWIATLQVTLNTMPGVGAVGCRVISTQDDFWSRCADFVLFSATQQVFSCYRPLGCGALAVRREAFEKIQGFDSTLLASEDWDFSLRLHQAGWSTYFNATATVLHDHARGHFKAIMRQAWQSGWQSGLTVQNKHHATLGPSAHLAMRLTQSPFYPLFGVPYAMAVTLLHAWEMRRSDRRWMAFIFFLAIGRFCYQMGVWSRIRQDLRANSHAPIR